MAETRQERRERKEGFEAKPPTRREMERADRESSRPYRESYEQGRKDEQESRSGRSERRGQINRTKSVVTPHSPQRVIVGTMAFGVTFALLATELSIVAPGTTAGNRVLAGTQVRPVTIMIGGGVATILLLVVSHAGEGGAQLAEGLALVSMVTTLLVTGKPVWDFTNKLFGSKPTGGLNGKTYTTLSTNAVGQPQSNPPTPAAGPPPPPNPFLQGVKA